MKRILLIATILLAMLPGTVFAQGLPSLGSEQEVVGVVWGPYEWTRDPTNFLPFITYWCDGIFQVPAIPIRVSFCVRTDTGYQWNHGDWYGCDRDCGDSDRPNPPDSIVATPCCREGLVGNPLPCFLGQALMGVVAKEAWYYDWLGKRSGDGSLRVHPSLPPAELKFDLPAGMIDKAELTLEVLQAPMYDIEVGVGDSWVTVTPETKEVTIDVTDSVRGRTGEVPLLIRAESDVNVGMSFAGIKALGKGHPTLEVTLE